MITEVGHGVSKHRVGDRVMVCSSGSFTTSMDVSEHLCVTTPDTLTFEEAASMPVVYSTVIYSLLDAARLTEGMVSTYHRATCGWYAAQNTTDTVIMPRPFSFTRQLVVWGSQQFRLLRWLVLR